MSEWILSETPGFFRLASADFVLPMAAFSTRTGGVSSVPFDTLNLGESVGDDPHAVRENRTRLLAAFGLEVGRVAYARQVHGAVCLDAREPGVVGHGDALVTEDLHLALAVSTADCLPLLLWDRGHRVAAAVHAGWRGAAGGVVTSALQAMAARGVSAADVQALLGPRIGPCCFEVGPEVLDQFPVTCHAKSGSRNTLDLGRAVGLELARAGVPSTAVAELDHCTTCSPERYFSHRRDGPRTGRHWSLIALAAR